MPCRFTPFSSSFLIIDVSSYANENHVKTNKKNIKKKFNGEENHNQA